jgi:hypothetical protein
VRVGVLAVVVGIGAGAACYDPTIPLELPCATSGPRCPDGQVCDPVRDVCVASIEPDAPEDPAIDAPVAIDAGPPDADRCPGGYVMLASLPHRYRQVDEPMTWAGARDTCAAEGAYLAIPDGDEEAAAIALFDDTWIGITDVAAEGTWVTVNGQFPSYFAWAPGEPDDDTTEEPTGQDCGTVYGTMANFARFDDTYCSAVRMHAFVCECEP